MNLYFIGHNNENGDNRDAIIEAPDQESAIRLWRVEFDTDVDDVPDTCGQIKQTGKFRMIPWTEIVGDE